MPPLRRIVVAPIAALLIVGAALHLHRAPPVAAYSIERSATYQNDALLARGWALPVARLYGPQGYLYQKNQSVCGPTSIADLLHSEGVNSDPAEVLSHARATQVAGFLPKGLTLDEEAELLERETGKPVKILRGLTLDAFREEIAQSNDPGKRYIVNFLRMPLFGRGHGHFSPILGYLADEDLVFVGDVNAAYRPWIVSTQKLFEAQDTIDTTSHRKRGLLEVEAQ